MASQREILEERLRASGLKADEAKSVAKKVFDAQNPIAAWDAIFNTSIQRHIDRAVDEVFKIQTLDMRIITTRRIFHNLLARSLYVPLDKARGRRNLEALGVSKRDVDYAISRHGKFTVAQAERQIARTLADNRAGKVAVAEAMRTAARAALIDQVMRGEEVALGEPVSAVVAIVTIVVSVISALLAIAGAIIGWIMQGKASRDAEEYNEAQRRRPIDNAELIAATARIIAKHENELSTVRWSEIREEYLRDIRAIRDNRSSFVEGEEELCREEFNRQKTDILQAQREIAMIQARGALEESAVATARQRNAARAALMQGSFSAVLSAEDTQRSETRSKWLRRGLIALGLGGAGVVVYKLASR